MEFCPVSVNLEFNLVSYIGPALSMSPYDSYFFPCFCSLLGSVWQFPPLIWCRTSNPWLYGQFRVNLHLYLACTMPAVPHWGCLRVPALAFLCPFLGWMSASPFPCPVCLLGVHLGHYGVCRRLGCSLRMRSRLSVRSWRDEAICRLGGGL